MKTATTQGDAEAPAPTCGATSQSDYCEHLLRPGNTNCAGCGMSIGLQWLNEAMNGHKPIMSIPACCGIVTAGQFPTSAYGVPVAATTFASSAAVATGLAAVRDMNHESTPIICWAGDGGTYDIGLATLSAAAERNENITYFCYDNEIYGNTGGQRSSATPAGVATTTTPHGKIEPKKDIMGIMAAHRVPFAATLSVAHRDDFLRKVRKALQTRGFSFLLLLSPCPTGWKSEPSDSIDLIGAAVRSGLFPLYEVFDGVRYRINERPDGLPVTEYLKHQRRFRTALEDPSSLEQFIEQQWHYLDGMAKMFPAKEDE